MSSRQATEREKRSLLLLAADRGRPEPKRNILICILKNSFFYPQLNKHYYIIMADVCQGNIKELFREIAHARQKRPAESQGLFLSVVMLIFYGAIGIFFPAFWSFWSSEYIKSGIRRGLPSSSTQARMLVPSARSKFVPGRLS